MRTSIGDTASLELARRLPFKPVKGLGVQGLGFRFLRRRTDPEPPRLLLEEEAVLNRFFRIPVSITPSPISPKAAFRIAL